MSFSRHTMRVAAFQVLFALVDNPQADEDKLYRQVLKLDANEPVPKFAASLVDGVKEYEAEIDQTIEEYLAPGWSLNRLTRPNLVILRLAVYELKYEDLPAAIVINEALQLAKDFSDDKSRRFINGVLGHYEKDLAEK